MRNIYPKGNLWKLAVACAITFLFTFHAGQKATAGNPDGSLFPSVGGILLAPPLSNDVCSTASTISPGLTTWTDSTTLAGNDTVPFCTPVGNSNGGGLWYKTTGTGEKFTVSTCNAGTVAGFDTELRVYKGSCGNLVCVGANDDVLPDSCSEFQWCTQNGVTYWILITGDQGDEGTFELSLTATGYADPSFSGLCSGPIFVPATCFACIGDVPDTLQIDGDTGGVFTGPGITANVFNPTIAGVDTHGIVYSVVDTVSGCTVSDTQWVIVYPMAIVLESNDTTVCPGASAILNGGTADSWWWSTGASVQIITVDTAGTFWVSIVDSNGCEAMDSIVISNFEAPDVDLGSDTSICVGDTLCLDAGSGVAVLWNDGDNSQIKCDYKVSVHSVTITDTNGCQDKDTLWLGINQLPVVDLDEDEHNCKGDTVWYMLDTNDVMWTWSNGKSTVSVAETQTDSTLSVIVKDTNDCFNYDTVSVIFNELPLADFRPMEFICSNDTNNGVCLDAGDDFDYYEWSTGNNNQIQCYYAADTAFVYLEDSVGCFDTIWVVIDTADPVMVNITGAALGCPGDTLFYSATIPGIDSYLWWDLDGITNPMPDDSNVTSIWNTTNLIVEIEDTNGCWNSDTMMVEFRPVPNPMFDDTVTLCKEDLPYCYDALTQFSVSYEWQDNSTQQVLCPSSTKWIWVDVTDDNGCWYRDSSFFNLVELVADLGPEDSCVHPDSTIILDAGVPGYEYDWWLHNKKGPNVQAIGYQINGANPDTIVLRIYDASGCESERDTLFLWDMTNSSNPNSPCIVAIADLKNVELFTVYPNPNQGQFSITFMEVSGNGATIEVLDVHGRLVESRILSNVAASATEQFNLSGLGSGIYQVRVMTNGQTISRKISIF